MRPVVFDLDGVLVDSARLYAAIIGEVLAEAGHPADADAILGATIPHVPRWVDAVLPADVPDRDRVVTDLAREVRRRVAARSDEPHLQERAREVLAEVARDHALVLLTNSSAGFARGVLSHGGLLDLFGRVITSDDDYGEKDRALGALAREHGVDPAELVYVGDTARDVAWARRAGCRVVIVHSPFSWDRSRRHEIVAAAPDALVSSLDEVPGALQGGVA